MNNLQTGFAFTVLTFLFSFTTVDFAALNYIEKFKLIAIGEMHRTGIPASITLAQGLLESGNGLSTLATKANNHFGIKCNNNWTGEGFYIEDDDYVNKKLIKSCFRKYTSAEASYYDHSEFLMVNQRYAFLFKLDKSDYKGWAKGLKKAGYATAGHYAKSLIRLIEEYELYKYDSVLENTLVTASEELTDAPAPKPILEGRENRSLSEATTTRSSAETLVATAPPKSIAIPENYRPGDGLKKVIERKKKPSFHEDVYGGPSSKYLDAITPQIAKRD